MQKKNDTKILKINLKFKMNVANEKLLVPKFKNIRFLDKTNLETHFQFVTPMKSF